MSEQRPRVSVLMTIYNAAPYLKLAIDSIVAQSFCDWELIAVENGSRDDSFSILSGYQDDRIRVFRLPENIGRTPALRHAFEQVRGEYIAVLDADDVSHPERFGKQVAHLDSHPAIGLLGSWVEQIDERGEIIGRFEPPVEDSALYEALCWSNPFVHSSVMYRSGWATELGGYSPAYAYAQDLALILAMVRNGKLRVGMMGERLCSYRICGSSVTRTPGSLLTIGQEQLALLREAAEILPMSVATATRNRRRQAVAQLKIGVALLRSAKRAEGLGRIVTALIKAPSILVCNGVVDSFFSAGRGTK